MSHSPLGESGVREAMNPRSPFRTRLNDLNERIDRGGSLSGHERNCAFLNIGDSRRARFATVSNSAGFDFADDSRSLGIVDWDRDGDLDVWLMNRTAPRVRLLQNDQVTGNHFIAFRLKGETCNRDAIGARIEVVCEEGQRLSKSLRAGEGFLSQSSKSIHFGLGSADTIKTVTVKWPGGPPQDFSNLEANRFYLLQQGNHAAEPVAVNRAQKAWNTSGEFVAEPPSEQAAVLLTSRIAMPRLTYQTAAGKSAQLDDLKGRAVLINLWASWCLPCQRELKDLVDHSAEFEAKRLEVVALSTDGLLDDQTGTNDENVRRIMQSIGGAIRSGYASRALVARLQFMDDYLFAQKRELPVPTSFLMDSEGRLAAIYRGPVDVPKVILDVEKLSLKGKESFDAALPFPGRWYEPNEAAIPLRLAARMYEQGDVIDAAGYLHDHRESFSRQVGYVSLVGQVASKLAGQRRQTEAIQLYRDALKASPDNVALINNLAWHLATHVETAERRPAEAIQLAERAAKMTDYGIVNVIDTLVAAHLSADRRGDAVIACRRALRRARERNHAELMEQLTEKLRRLEQ